MRRVPSFLNAITFVLVALAMPPLAGADEPRSDGPFAAPRTLEPLPPLDRAASASAPTLDDFEQLRRRLDATEAELRALRQQGNGPYPVSPAALNQPLGVEPGDMNTEQRIAALEQAASAVKSKFPLIRLSGFMQVDDGLLGQSPANRALLGNIQDGAGFRRTRLQALGSLTEITRYSIEVDFAVVGRPSFMDVWGEQSNIPFFSTIRIGQFRQPTTMDAMTSIRHLDFMERNAPFQAMDPFRRLGIMSWRVAEDEMSTLAYSVFANGFSFFNGASNVYNVMGDTRYGTLIGTHGGVAAAIRGTHLLYYDEPSEGRYLLHVGGGYTFGQIGGSGTSGLDARAYEARSIPEFFVGDPNGAGLTAAGTPFVVDSGRILADNYHFAHLELAGNYGSAHFQTEYLVTFLNQMNGPMVFYDGAYVQCGYFLTGETEGYNKQSGVADYNVQPLSPFMGAGPPWKMCGWGAWEVAMRWSYLDLSARNVLPQNYVASIAGPPPVPNPGVLNESTLALNWYWNQYTRVQFNWIHSMIDNNAQGFSALDIFASRFQVEF